MPKKKKEFKPEYLDDWPSHYYQLNDPYLRELCLKEYLKQHPDSQEDLRRLEIFNHRYGSSVRKQDMYFYGWSMLKAVSQSSRFLNRRRREMELREYFIDLAVLSTKTDELQKKEWENFAADFMEKSLKGSSYGSTLLGLGKVSERDKLMRIANDIHTITFSLPLEVYLEKEAEPLRNILEQAFLDASEDGSDILNVIR